jgi:predicted cupin superfamily sugar epimerase
MRSARTARIERRAGDDNGASRTGNVGSTDASTWNMILAVTDASEVIEILQLTAHPEGGWFRETWRHSDPSSGGRGTGTAIYYLLAQGERSHWHRIDAAEIWHFYAGDPLHLSWSPDGADMHEIVLGSDVTNRQEPQLVVPADAWQSASTSGQWSLVGCTVSPAFEFDMFELAPPDWRPGR